mmetsp:Transcript_43246/g.99689  ORF Transcript_43246/g.99689 Transcript_43246/m.99689 type:complete len:173 (+) Transcript_43246:61-579(+)
MLLGGGALGLPRLLGAVSSRICAQAVKPVKNQPNFLLATSPLLHTPGSSLLGSVRCGGHRRAKGPPELTSSFAPYPMVPYGVKRSAAFKATKKAARKAAERARRAAEEKAMILDVRKVLRMELKRNTGIGWGRSLQIIKHLEMHENGKGPPIDQAMREKITKIAQMVKLGMG